MAIGTNILMKKLYRKFWNPKLKMYDFEEILPDILLSNVYADMNFDHINKLTDLNVLAGIEVPSLSQSNKERCKFYNNYFNLKLKGSGIVMGESQYPCHPPIGRINIFMYLCIIILILSGGMNLLV